MIHEETALGIPEPSPNGTKKPRRKKKTGLSSDAGRGKPPDRGDDDNWGCLASEMPDEEVKWLLNPWFPMGMVSLIAGRGGVGKSSLLAYLVARAGDAALLPGFEENPKIMVKPRLVANYAEMKRVRFLNGREYRLPTDKTRIASLLRKWQVRLLTVDPVHSYMESGKSRNDGADVRAYLEAFAWIASEVGCAVVGVMHPGKDKMNILPGSIEWRNVPRSVVELLSDGGNPPRIMIRTEKYSLGKFPKPVEYRLEGEERKAPRFVLGCSVDESISELAAAAESPTDRRAVLEACKLIRHLFEQQDDPTVEDLVNECRKLGIGDRARNEARRLLGVDIRPMSGGGKWIMRRWEKEWPSWLPKDKK